MIKKLLLLIICLNLFTNQLQAKPIIADVSSNEILIDTSFTGQKLFLFGARNVAGDIVIVVRGPKNNYIVRKKEEFFGVWLNRKQMKFSDIYGFYAIYSSADPDKLSNPELLRNLNLGFNNLPLSYKGEAHLEDIELFKGAILEKHLSDALYLENYQEIELMGDTLFKTHLNFTKKIPHGSYNIELYLIRDNNLIATETIPIQVRTTGFESFVHHAAHQHKILYGIFCVLAALMAGWVASRIFWKV